MRFLVFARTGLVASLLAATAHGATFTVTNVNDSGVGSLRNAITQANANADADTIEITATGTINIETALPIVSTPVTIKGPGASLLNVHRSSANPFGVLDVRAATEISGVTVSNGKTSGSAAGAITASAPLTLTECVISQNAGSPFAGVYTTAKLTVVRSIFTGNNGSSALYALDNATVTDSTFIDNTATAVAFPPGSRTLTMTGCTVSNNHPVSAGIGGLQVQGGTANVRNCTFSGNGGALGGDFWTYSDGVVINLINVTSVDAKSPALLFDHSATVTTQNTIFAGTGARCGNSKAISKGHNISTDDTCNLAQAGDKPKTDPKLGALADNGGPTKTHALLPGSPAINAGENTDAGAFDQRGQPRVVDGTVDIGAYEWAPPLPDAGPDADASSPDGAPDAAPVYDASTYDAGTYDGGLQMPAVNGVSDDDCGCDVVGQATQAGTSAAAFLGALGVAMVRRRRRR